MYDFGESKLETRVLGALGEAEWRLLRNKKVTGKSKEVGFIKMCWMLLARLDQNSQGGGWVSGGTGI